ncbi:MAG: RecX family transcriptional regulator [Clostridia bacterium]|nr:RecX family transcriptional regulator [Clostridia bacterium]
MTATVRKIREAKNGEAALVTLFFPCPAGGRTHTYRLTAEEYAEAGYFNEGEELEEEDFLPFTDETDRKEALERAVRILASGDNTAAALTRKLRDRGFLPHQAEEAVQKLQKAGYIRENDMLERQFAVFAARLWGPGKYRPALLQKGFSLAQVEEAEEKAAETGVYDKEKIKEALLLKFRPEGRAETVALLYRYGFRQ